MTAGAGRLLEHPDYDRDIIESCDYLVIGSGPGGAIAAERLSRSGARVIVVEAGPVARRDDFKVDSGYTLSRYFWYGGLRTTTGNVFMPTMQPRNLGGGSVWNSAICLRTPEWQLERWEREHGLTRLSGGGLARHYDEVERLMGVRPTRDEVQGPRNHLFKRAAEAVGLEAEPIWRNEFGCRGSGECASGCPNEAKLSTDRRGLPEVIERGNLVMASVAAERLIVEGRQVRGMYGSVVHPRSGRRSYQVTIRAKKATVLAAGALASPEILQRSGIDGPAVGANLRFHPGTITVGLFDDEILPWSGATQGYHVRELLRQGIKLESVWVSPSLVAFRFPGLGRPLQELMARYRYMATWDAWVSGQDSVGYVRRQRGQRAEIHYDVGQGDVERMKEASARLAEMYFAVGARSVLLGLRGVPEEITSPADIGRIRDAELTPQDLPTASNHIFGSLAMGADPRRHACDPSGAAYGYDHLYYADTSILPDIPSANPMLPAMALSHMVAEDILGRT